MALLSHTWLKSCGTKAVDYEIGHTILSSDEHYSTFEELDYHNEKFL